MKIMSFYLSHPSNTMHNFYPPCYFKFFRSQTNVGVPISYTTYRQYLQLFKLPISSIQKMKIHNFLNSNCSYTLNSKNIKILSLLNSNCLDATNSENMKTNCPSTPNSRNIKTNCLDTLNSKISKYIVPMPPIQKISKFTSF